jgi:hypothetical protein
MSRPLRWQGKRGFALLGRLAASVASYEGMRSSRPFLLAFMVAASAGAQSAEWRPDGIVDGIQIEKRDVAGSGFDELRVTATSPAPLEALCLAIYPKPYDPRPVGHVKKRELLRETENDRWTYELVAVPVVSDRDYVIHYKLVEPPSSGRCEVSFETLNEGVRPPPPGVVRIPMIRGRWSLAPIQSGKVVVHYQIFTDPGGSVPAFVARGGMRDSAIDYMKIVLAKALAAKP